jgi:hypothetical protein
VGVDGLVFEGDGGVSVVGDALVGLADEALVEGLFLEVHL